MNIQAILSTYLNIEKNARNLDALLAVFWLKCKKTSHDSLPQPDARPEVHALAKKFLSSRMHSNLERCIGSLAKNLPYSAEALSLALLYIDSLQRLYDNVVNCWTLDRMFATAVVVASKFAFDEVYPSTYYAARLGLSIYELNDLELTFLCLFGFKLHPDRQRWIRLHCFIARLAYEPTQAENGSRGSCPCLEVPLNPSSRRPSLGSPLTMSGCSSPSTPSPVTPMISAVDTPKMSKSGLIVSQSGIRVTVSSLLSPESSSNSPKKVEEVVSTYGKTHSGVATPQKIRRHHHHHRKKPSIVDTN